MRLPDVPEVAEARKSSGEIIHHVAAATARKDYGDRRQRVAEGRAKAQAAGKYRGKPEEVSRNAGIPRCFKAARPIPKCKPRWVVRAPPSPRSRSARWRHRRVPFVDEPRCKLARSASDRSTQQSALQRFSDKDAPARDAPPAARFFRRP